MVVVAVEHLDVDAGFRHASRELTELSRNHLLEPLHHDFTFLQHRDPGGLERSTRRGAVGKKKMCDAGSTHDPRAPAFDAHTRAPQRFPHAGQLTGAILELDGEVFHDEVLDAALRMEGWQRTSVFTELAMKQSSWAWW